MANYLSDGKKSERVATKYARALEGALRHQATESRVRRLAQRLREAKIQAAAARKDEPGRARWESMSIEQVLEKYTMDGAQ